MLAQKIKIIHQTKKYVCTFIKMIFIFKFVYYALPIALDSFLQNLSGGYENANYLKHEIINICVHQSSLKHIFHHHQHSLMVLSFAICLARKII